MKTIALSLLLATLTSPRSNGADASASVVTTNWVIKTHWVQSPASYRMLGGKLQDANQPPWETVVFSPTHQWSANWQRFVPISNGRGGSGYRADISIAANQSSQLPPRTKLFHIRSQWLFAPRITICVSNVPMTEQALLDGGAAGLSRALSLRAFPMSGSTNMAGFKITETVRNYDYGVPYSGKVPVVTRKAIYLTNQLETQTTNKTEKEAIP